MNNDIAKHLKKYNYDRTRLLDILLDIQQKYGYINDDSIPQIAEKLNLSESEVCETVTFYHFFKRKPSKYTIYLNNSVTSIMAGAEKVAKAFEESCGINFGDITPDGMFGLYYTSCIGMNDQEPAALINGKVFTNLTPYRVRELIKLLREGKPLENILVESLGDGNNCSDIINTMVRNNIRRKGILLQNDYSPFEVIQNGLSSRSPEEIIAIIEGSNLRGRGGAGFPTGLKWRFGRKTESEHKIIICNADEGEPGTFKDRVLLTEHPELVFEGMVLAAYATGADMGILYLRYEYKYLLEHLNGVLDKMRSKNLIGKNTVIGSRFNFDIRIQLGAGAYVCGEESALIESMEGKRGEPRDKPPFPVEKGFLCYPTIVNNVETLAMAVKIIKYGAAWFESYGTPESSGMKLLSVSGDCKFPGIYEVEWGTTVNEILEMSGAYNVQAVQVGGPSGTLIGKNDFDRQLCYSNLATGGSMIIFDNSRNLIKEVIINFMDFFIEESCGSCSTCRIMPVLLKEKINKILAGHGTSADLTEMEQWTNILRISRCGLGQTAGNPVKTSLKNFLPIYETLINKDVDYDPGFELEKAVLPYKKFVENIITKHF